MGKTSIESFETVGETAYYALVKGAKTVEQRMVLMLPASTLYRAIALKFGSKIIYF